MSEKLKPVRPPTTAEERRHWGEIKDPPRYPDTLGKRIGNKLMSLFTPWKG